MLTLDPPLMIGKWQITPVCKLTTTAAEIVGQHVFAGTKIPVAVVMDDGVTRSVYPLDPEETDPDLEAEIHDLIVKTQT